MKRLPSPLIALSALLVFGTTYGVLRNLDPELGELRFGFEQLIHARIPWLMLGLLWGGLAMGIVAIARRRSVTRWLVVGAELLVVAAISAYVAGSFPPPHTLALDVGDRFPAYTLTDQDGKLRSFEPGKARAPALYIFYRGDW